MTSTSSWSISVEEDPETGELILPFPAEFLAEKGWKDGDTLSWIDNQDGSWTLEKIDDNE